MSLGKMWYRDEDVGTERAERSRSKGSLQIILHAMFKGGWLIVRGADGKAPVLEEWHRGQAHSCEMVFRGKVAGGDYHENMDGVMFMKWINTRLVPTIRRLHPDKKVYLVMDNAPYHHGRSEDAYFCAGRTKDDIQGKLCELGLRQLAIKPYEHLKPSCGEFPTAESRGGAYDGWCFFEKTTGECYMVDGLSDEGEGNVVVYTRVAASRFGSVESSFVQDFRRLLNEDFCFVGRDESALLYLRSQMGKGAKLARNNRDPRKHIRGCARLRTRLRASTWKYKVDDLHKTYNGNGTKGNGGPNADLLRKAADAWIAKHHPRLRMTEVMQRFEELGWEIIFTVPYWAKSQPIELDWAYIKNNVARMYFPGRDHKDLLKQILAGMYGGRTRTGIHTGLTPELAQKLIAHTQAYQ